jgi:hypothetical protein
MRMRWRARGVAAAEQPSGEPFATFGLTEGTAVFGLALPQGWATDGVQVGALDTQTDVLLTWGDGSIRHCVVSCVVPTTGNYDIADGPATSGSFTPTWPSASVAFNIGGTTYTATLPSRTTTDPWLVGPHVQEHRVKVVPVNGATPHPALEVIFDVRSFAEGGHRVDICAQNVKDDADNNAFTYDLTTTVGGSGVLSGSGFTQPLMTRWRRAFVTGGAALSAITYDMEPYHLSYAIPRYDAGVSNSPWPDSGTLADADYNILAFGDMTPGMGSPGGRPELAPFPQWWAEWIVHQEADAFAYGIRAAEQSGSWSDHLTNPDGSSITIEDEPGYWLDGANRGGSMSIPGDPENFNFLVGLGEELEINHIPQLNLVPYIVTGDRFHIDQCRLWAHASLLKAYTGDGWRAYSPSAGVGGMNLWPHQVRGNAWGLRTIAEAAVFLPDGDPDKAYLIDATTRNLKFFDWVALTLDPGGPLGIPLVSTATGGATTLAVVSWQNDYVLYALDRCHALGFTDGQDLKTQLAAWRVRLFSSDPDFPKEWGAPYWMPFPSDDGGVGAQTSGGNNPNEGGGTPTIPAGVGRTWLTMEEIYDTNFGDDLDPENVSGPYGGDALLGLAVAVQMGLTGAATAYTFLSGVANPVHAGWQLIGVAGSED